MKYHVLKDVRNVGYQSIDKILAEHTGENQEYKKIY